LNAAYPAMMDCPILNPGILYAMTSSASGSARKLSAQSNQQRAKVFKSLSYVGVVISRSWSEQASAGVTFKASAHHLSFNHLDQADQEKGRKWAPSLPKWKLWPYGWVAQERPVTLPQRTRRVFASFTTFVLFVS
jgi:hypothetical protein